MNTRSELGKLARVQVDVPNALDHLWALDIKKSVATPPRELRESLRRFAGQFVRPSSRAHEFRGRRPKKEDDVVRTWQLVEDRESFRYEVNREHPLVRQLESQLTSEAVDVLEGVLRMLETTFPVMDAHNRLSQDRSVEPAIEGVEAAVRRAVNLRSMFHETFPRDDEYLAFIRGTEPFNTVEGFEDAFREAVRRSE